MKGLNELGAEINRTAREHGWWEQERNFGEMIALMHSELSEALEAHRNHRPAYYLEHSGTGDGKPEGWGVELIDCIIRILDTLYAAGVDADDLMHLKQQYNEGRPYKHGGKRY